MTATTAWTTAAVLGVAWAAALATLAVRRARALAEVGLGVQSLGEGRPVRPIQARVGGAAGRLARQFNLVAPGLEDRLAQLEGDRQQLRAVLGGLAEGVVAVDARSRLVFANDAADRLFDLGPSAVGRLVAELIRAPQVHEAIDATLLGPGPHRAEIAVPGLEGWPRAPERSFSVQGTPLPGNPPPGAVIVFQDVTEIRRLERVRQDFVANASHELKTPLAAIKAYTETLIDGALYDEEVNVRFLSQIDDQADRLDRLIQDLLSLARLESGHDLYNHIPTNLAPVVRRSVEAHRARAEAKEIRYKLDMSAEAERAVAVADEEAIRQVVDNLVDNAIKYTPDGGRIGVNLSVERSTIALVVADTGIGIPRDDLPRIFERFYRVDKARSREMGGTGLGLSIVKHLVGSLGGTVAVESRPGVGTTFTVRLPAAAEGVRPGNEPA